MTNRGDQSGKWGKDSFMAFGDGINTITDVREISVVCDIAS